ncbi:sodium-dependent galactose transporter [Cutibacterium acnes JCM 18918]|nr:sodium-dependent galactose transporter [Cutibacterium acnes JCM 18918]
MYSETPKEHLVDPLEKDLPWYRRTVPLGMTVLAITVVLNIIF